MSDFCFCESEKKKEIPKCTSLRFGDRRGGGEVSSTASGGGIGIFSVSQITESV
jgi:hypothetical protein